MSDLEMKCQEAEYNVCCKVGEIFLKIDFHNIIRCPLKLLPDLKRTGFFSKFKTAIKS